MKDRNSPIRAPTFTATALLALSGLLLSVGPSSLSAQACLGESPLTNRTVSLTTGLAVSEVVVPEVSVRTALPHGFTVGAGWNRLDPDGEVSRGNDIPAHDVWSGVVAMEVDHWSSDLSLCPLVRLVRGEWSRTEPTPFHPGTATETETATILAAGFGYALTLPLDREWAPAFFVRAEAQRYWVAEKRVWEARHDDSGYTETSSDASTEFMSRFGVVLPWERWTGSAWVGIGTFDGHPPTPHAAGDPVFGMSLGVSF